MRLILTPRRKMKGKILIKNRMKLHPKNWERKMRLTSGVFWEAGVAWFLNYL
jgi:hypothetical protein